jgi:hydroxymethylpyrimidine pyrophosphatase-like HAD family hydrolase
MRPGSLILRHELKSIQDAISSGAHVLLVDDPPRSGASMRRLTEQIHSLGVPRDRVVLLIPLLGPAGSTPSSLGSYRCVELAWNEWSINDELAPGAVATAMRELLAGRTITVSDQHGDRSFRVGEVTRVETSDLDANPDQRQVRTHVRKAYKAYLTAADASDVAVHQITACGAGYGYLGRHELAVGHQLVGGVPEVLGFRNGLLFQTLRSDEARASDWHALTPHIAGYVHARAKKLTVADDRTLSMTGVGSVWQRFSDVLSRSLGRARLLGRPFLHQGTRRLLRSTTPMVIDGFMALPNWRQRTDGRVTKDHFADAAFSSQDLFSYDPVFDLGAAVVQAAMDDYSVGRELAPRLRREYESIQGLPIRPERWLANLLANALYERDRWTERIPQPDAIRRVESLNRAMSAFHADYLGTRLLAGVSFPVRGPLCAIDLDGVLETWRLGYSASTPAGIGALGALMRHGYRPVLVTGRSLNEVRERCAAYSLPGGVAEYGGWAYDVSAGTAVRLVNDEQMADLARLAAVAQAMGATLDPSYSTVVRVFVHSPDGRRRHPSADFVESALRDAGVVGRVSAVTGYGQTDFLPNGVDKGNGLRVLASYLGAEANAQPLVALAVGDTSSDIPMLDLAQHRCGPANAERSVVESGAHISSRPYQAGLADAARRLLGHAPGACPQCSTHCDPAAEFVIAALSAEDVTGLRKLWTVINLARASRAGR